MAESTTYTSLLGYEVEQIAFGHLKQIFSTVEKGTRLELANGGSLDVDIVARSIGGRLIVFDIKHVTAGKRLPHSSYLDITSLKEAASNIRTDAPAILIVLTTAIIDKVMQGLMAEAGVPVVVLGKNVDETRERLREALSQFSIALPEFSPERPVGKTKIGSCFVTVPSLFEFESIFSEAIQPAILDSGFDVIRWPQIGRIDSPMEELLKLLRRTQIVVADITDQNPNVLFHVGAAYGLGRRIVITCQQGTEIPSDLRSIRYIQYLNSPQGLERFRTMLQEILAPFQQWSTYIANLRTLLVSAFNDEELTSLCYDSFPEVYNSLSSGMSKASRVQFLLEYCQRRDLFNSLLRVIQSTRPDQYARWMAEAKEK